MYQNGDHQEVSATSTTKPNTEGRIVSGAHDPWATLAFAAAERHRRPLLPSAEDHTDATDQTADVRCGHQAYEVVLEKIGIPTWV